MDQRSFTINSDLLKALDEYHERTMLMENHVIRKIPHDDIESAINDDLIYNVPIYDMGNRRYAAFCSLLEALWYKENDVKGNGIHFTDIEVETKFDWFMIFYLFRLCGSGINYNPNTLGNPYGTHGFGNFWIIDCLLNGQTNHVQWLETLKNKSTPFTDNKGYLLPQFSYPNQKGGHLKRFILEESEKLVGMVYGTIRLDGLSIEDSKFKQDKYELFEITDIINSYLKTKGYKRQNFVGTAFAADIAEYFPEYVDPKSRTYAGTNATKCIKQIFPKNGRVKEFDYINDVLAFQSDRYGLSPISCEDSRNCDPIRYFQEYQSNDHIAANDGKVMKNNSILKKLWGEDKYYSWAKQLK